MTRTKVVGDLGEGLIVRLLKRAGFDDNSIRDLNQTGRYNHPGGDFLNKRAAIEYFISVYKRDVQGRRRLNGGYNLYPEKVRRAARAYNAVPAWATIQIDTERQTLCAYFGTVDELQNPHAIAVPMTPSAVADYECLAKDEFCAEITPELSNQLPDHRPGSSSSLYQIGPNSCLLKKEQFPRREDNFRHARDRKRREFRDNPQMTFQCSLCGTRTVVLATADEPARLYCSQETCKAPLRGFERLWT
jgi:hypothetical protein